MSKVTRHETIYIKDCSGVYVYAYYNFGKMTILHYNKHTDLYYFGSAYEMLFRSNDPFETIIEAVDEGYKVHCFESVRELMKWFNVIKNE